METDLMVLIDKSGLSQIQKDLMTEKFGDAFQIAKEWKEKAYAIEVTDANQTAEMKMARVGRLFLREKRIAIEKTRKEMKESSLREGKAIEIEVTDANQTAEMKMARVGRLFLREKRIAIEKTRKEMKESSLREGKAIDLIAK